MPGKSKILVAEDELAIRQLITVRLELAGYEVFTARTGREALGRLAVTRPSAMVLDINMPELDGFGVLEAMRDPRSRMSVPVLVLTARHGSDDVRRAVSLGARDYLTKPFSEAQLLARVARLLRKPFEAPAAVRTAS